MSRDRNSKEKRLHSAVMIKIAARAALPPTQGTKVRVSARTGALLSGGEGAERKTPPHHLQSSRRPITLARFSFDEEPS